MSAKSYRTLDGDFAPCDMRVYNYKKISRATRAASLHQNAARAFKGAATMAVFLIMGRPGAGKSFYAIKKFILPAVNGGRRVVHNIEGLQGEELGAPPLPPRLVKRGGVTVQEGTVLPESGRGTNGQGGIFVHNSSLLNFPLIDLGDKGEVKFTGGLARGGDLWVFDEMALVFARAVTETQNTQINTMAVMFDFLSGHRHFTGDGYSFDLVLLCQHDGQLNRGIFNCVAETIIMRSSMIPNRFRALRFEGASSLRGCNPGDAITDETIKADAKIFALYNSFSGGEVGKTHRTPIPWRVFSSAVFFVCVAVAVNWYNWDVLSDMFGFGPTETAAVNETVQNRRLIRGEKTCGIYWNGNCVYRRY